MVFCTNCQADVDLEYADAGALSCCPQCGRVFDDAGFSNDLTFAKGADGEGEMVGQYVSATGQVSGRYIKLQDPSPSDLKASTGQSLHGFNLLEEFVAAYTESARLSVLVQLPATSHIHAPPSSPQRHHLQQHPPSFRLQTPPCTPAHIAAALLPTSLLLAPSSTSPAPPVTAWLCLSALRSAACPAWATATGCGARGRTASRWP